MRGRDTQAVSLGQYILPVGGVLALTILFALVFMMVPFLLSGSVYCALVGLVLGYRRYSVLVLISIGVPVFIWLMFETVLGIPLP